jgi:hypothetical protein
MPKAADDDLALVKRVAQEAPPRTRRLLSYLAHRPGEEIAFADLAPALDVPPLSLRAEMAQFSWRWKETYRQGKSKWFFDVITAEGGRVKYRMNARIAQAVLDALDETSAQAVGNRSTR